MPARRVEVTPALLRDWALPATDGDKYSRGRVLVVGGAARTPGAAMLAGLAALRVGAGHLTLAVAEPVAVALAVAVPESGVIGLPSNETGSVLGGGAEAIADELQRADVVLVGPGLDDLEETAGLVRGLLPHLGADTRVVLDAYALAQFRELPEVVAGLRGRVLLTPNSAEAQSLLGAESDIGDEEVRRIAADLGAVVSCGGTVTNPGGSTWGVGAGHSGLATSGSGDVLAGAIAGILAGGAELDQAACWATYAHAASGDRLAARIGRLGFWAREILDELPAVMVELAC